jgi:hypothetical protein
MPTTQERVIERHHADVLTRSISDLQTLSGQLSHIDDIDAERAKLNLSSTCSSKTSKECGASWTK